MVFGLFDGNLKGWRGCAVMKNGDSAMTMAAIGCKLQSIAAELVEEVSLSCCWRWGITAAVVIAAAMLPR